MDEVEAVARAIEDQLTTEDGWMVGTPALSSMCRDFALVAIAALDAVRGDSEPVAWLYEHPEGYYNTTTRRDDPSLPTYRGWIETPLYAHPPAPDAARGDPVARVVEWLRKENGLCDCHAHCETECGCGAWDDWKTKPLLEIADAIERGDPFNG